MKKILLLSIIFLASCSLNKVILHHGVHNLEQKQKKLKLEYSNKNDIVKLYNFLSTLREKIDDPLNKKRIKN
jgi:hypothetical protein